MDCFAANSYLLVIVAFGMLPIGTVIYQIGRTRGERFQQELCEKQSHNKRRS